jgi:two-component system response regulator
VRVRSLPPTHITIQSLHPLLHENTESTPFTAELLVVLIGEDGDSMAITNEDSHKKPFVLIAEDDEDDRIFFEEALWKFVGVVDFEFVENGRELIDYLSSRDSLPDLILLDLNMPLMDGREALKVIRSDPKLKGIPVTCLTTGCSPDDSSFCLDYGVALHEKPTSTSEFSALIQSQIRK